MFYNNCILNEVDLLTNHKCVPEEMCIDVCTIDYHVVNCDCHIKEEQQIKERKQKEKYDQNKVLCDKINNLAKQSDEQKTISIQKSNEFLEERQKYFLLNSQFNNCMFEYQMLIGKKIYKIDYNNPFTIIFDLLSKPYFNRM